MDNFPDKNINILEIGCGSGLLGIYLLQQGYKNITFQDYNEEVLRFWTVPNIMLNLGTEGLSGCSFIDGSWADFKHNNRYRNAQLPSFGQKYDLIFGCDIIYEVKNYQALIQLFEDTLTQNGMAIISSKAFYYGNGGSVAEFKDYLSSSKLSYQRLFNIQTGMSNRREIFCLQFK